jgi:hypothetical protein
MDKLPLGAITPLVITAPDITAPGQYVLPSRTVTFDLDGLGAAPWQWVTPETGILVWDPENRGDIRSAAQLFGNYTFRMIWRDGFHALSILDDDADGQVSGAELEGLALWHDANGNAVSEPGEVRPIQDHGVQSLHLDDVVPVEGMPLRPTASSCATAPSATSGTGSRARKAGGSRRWSRRCEGFSE